MRRKIITGMLALFLLAGVVLAMTIQVNSQDNGEPDVALQVDVTNAFTYQGYLTDGSGAVEGNCDLRFELWDALAGGVQLGTMQTILNVPLNNGRFTVSLNNAGQFGATAFTGQAHWLAISVRCPAGIGTYILLAPRQPLTAAPYALSLRPGAVINGHTPNGQGALTLSNSAGHGLVIKDTGGVGLLVDSADVDGLHVTTAGINGVYIDSAGYDGLVVHSAESAGIRVGTAGFSGLTIYSAGTDGVSICKTGSVSSCTSNSGANGLEIGHADDDGVTVIEADSEGLYVANSADGVQVDDATDNGIEVNGVTNWEGYFAGDINVTGSCTGCLLATFAINGGDRPLQKGEVVALQTLQSSTGNIENLPVSLAVVPASKGQAVIGVVAGRGELVGDDDEGSSRTLLVPREGTAAVGEYVHLIIYGLTQVQARGPVASGQRLTASDDGLTRSLQTIQIEGLELAENAPTIGMALEDLATGESRLIWVLVNIR